jgi:plastocyanin
MKFFIGAFIAITLGWVSLASAGSVNVDQINKKFKPGKVSIKVGDTLVFRNVEKKKRRHNVYSKTPGFEYVKIKVQNRGQSNEIKITNAGTFEVRCAFHPKMKMTVNATK